MPPLNEALQAVIYKMQGRITVDNFFKLFVSLLLCRRGYLVYTMLALCIALIIGCLNYAENAEMCPPR